MKRQEVILDILLLKRQGLSDRHIGRRLGVDPRTVKKYTCSTGQTPETEKMDRPSKLDVYRRQVEQWLEEDIEYQATWIFDHLKPMGYSGSYTIVKRLVRRLKRRRQSVAYLRFETEPARQAQVDFGEFVVEGPLGQVRKVYCFSMILGYSRMLYCEFLDRCDLMTFLDCHIRAF